MAMKKGDFTTLAESYGKYRPGYNKDVIKEIIQTTKLEPSAIHAADVGAGTGIFSRQLIKAGIASVSAVEPNAEMRNVGKNFNISGLVWKEGSAEKTIVSNDSGFDAFKASTIVTL